MRIAISRSRTSWVVPQNGVDCQTLIAVEATEATKVHLGLLGFSIGCGLADFIS